MEINPIGIVRRLKNDDELKWNKPETATIEIFEKYKDGLQGIEEFSHLYIFFHFNCIRENEKSLKVKPEGREDMPELGVFSTCSPGRPNSIGMTCVELISVEDNILTVSGLDAFDKTPVIDIKPFMEAPEQYSIPRWLVRLWEDD